MAIFTYTFEELPLVISNGIEAGLVSGKAEIIYACSGWQVRSISLEGFGERVNGVRQWPQVACPDAIATIIGQRLQGEWYDRVCDAVSEQIEKDREDAAEARADMRREDRYTGAF